MTDITTIEAQDEPELISLLFHACLLRAGGQQTFTLEELAEIATGYLGIRILKDMHSGALTLTLRARVGGLDPG
jgi:hypothetical protein